MTATMAQIARNQINLKDIPETANLFYETEHWKLYIDRGIAYIKHFCANVLDYEETQCCGYEIPDKIKQIIKVSGYERYASPAALFSKKLNQYMQQYFRTHQQDLEEKAVEDKAYTEAVKRFMDKWK